MLDWLFYLLFGIANPGCDTDSTHELAQCDTSVGISVQSGGGGADPIEPSKKGGN